METTRIDPDEQPHYRVVRRPASIPFGGMTELTIGRGGRDEANRPLWVRVTRFFGTKRQCAQKLKELQADPAAHVEVYDEPKPLG